MEISFYQAGQDPNDYASKYAEQNGISVEEAKESLKSTYGDPIEMGAGSLFQNSEIDDYGDEVCFDYWNSGNGPQEEGDPQPHINPSTGEVTGPLNEGDPELNIDSDEITNDSSFAVTGQDPEEYAQVYADDNGITLEEAKTILAELYGEPEQI